MLGPRGFPWEREEFVGGGRWKEFGDGLGAGLPQVIFWSQKCLVLPIDLAWVSHRKLLFCRSKTVKWGNFIWFNLMLHSQVFGQ